MIEIGAWVIALYLFKTRPRVQVTKSALPATDRIPLGVVDLKTLVTEFEQQFAVAAPTEIAEHALRHGEVVRCVSRELRCVHRCVPPIGDPLSAIAVEPLSLCNDARRNSDRR